VADLKKGARITGSTRDKLAADLKKKYEKGASIRALAESTGRSYGFVHRTLSEAGVTIRGRGGSTRAQSGAHTRTGQRAKSTVRTPVRAPKSEPREAAHQLVDKLPEERLPAVIELLRKETTGTVPDQARRRFRTVGVFAGEPDLGKRSKEISRRELGGKSSKTA
jgi:hypothetical protein